MIGSLTFASPYLLVLLLVPVLNITGAALASSIAYIVTVVVIVILFLRFSHVPARDLYAFRAADLAAYRELAAPFLRRARLRGGSG